MTTSRTDCRCHLDQAPDRYRTGPAGQTTCEVCGWIWVAPGWSGDRIRLFDDLDAQPAVPDAIELDLWYRLDRAEP